ncbi:MAG: hypothetical protein ABIH22_00940 [Candidatus Margulisiibacteriota bacterium]
MLQKDIICLANSIKLNNRCVAGKDINNYQWVRPVSDTTHGELSEEQIKFTNNEEPNLLDIIRINFKSKSPKYYQPENHIITDKKWHKIGPFPEDKLDDICDKPETIWTNSNPDTQRISLAYFKTNSISSSLLLIKANSLKIERSNFGEKKKYRAIFVYNDTEYNLPITDPKIRKEFESKPPGTYPINDKKIYLCLSIGEPFQPLDSSEESYCYKLVAAIIRVKK